jgi:hypothetical protein
LTNGIKYVSHIDKLINSLEAADAGRIVPAYDVQLWSRMMLIDSQGLIRIVRGGIFPPVCGLVLFSKDKLTKKRAY